MLTVPIAAVKQNGQGQDVVRVIDLDDGGKVTEVPVDDRPQRGQLHRGHEGSEGRRGRDRRSRHADDVTVTTTRPDDRAPRARGCDSHLRRRGQGPRAARRVAHDLGAGDFVSIVGPSGSGKSTMLGLLGCLDLPSEGVIRVGGVDVTTLDDANRSKLRGDSIGFVFQQFHLIPHLTALGNVETALLYRDMKPGTRRGSGHARAGTGRAWPSAPTTVPCRCRAASSSASRSHARS